MTMGKNYDVRGLSENVGSKPAGVRLTGGSQRLGGRSESGTDHSRTPPRSSGTQNRPLCDLEYDRPLSGHGS